MKEEQKSFEMLTGEVIRYLQKLSYSDSRISQYRSAWQRISAFMKEQDWEYYTATVGEAFIYHLIGKENMMIWIDGKKTSYNAPMWSPSFLKPERLNLDVARNFAICQVQLVRQ